MASHCYCLFLADWGREFDHKGGSPSKKARRVSAVSVLSPPATPSRIGLVCRHLGRPSKGPTQSTQRTARPEHAPRWGYGLKQRGARLNLNCTEACALSRACLVLLYLWCKCKSAPWFCSEPAHRSLKSQKARASQPPEPEQGQGNKQENQKSQKSPALLVGALRQ